jgi:hypothetical protein
VSRSIIALVLAAMLGTATVAHADGLPPQSGAMAVDTTSNHLYIAQPHSNAVFVLAAGTMRLLTVLDVPPSPSAITVDPARGRIYVASDAAGMITAFDDRTFNLLHIYNVGGHPSGLAMTDRGKTLLIGDGVDGTTQRLQALAPQRGLLQVFSVGTAGSSLLLAAPGTAWSGEQVRVWGRGFAPGERVGVYWEWARLTHVVANAAGMIKATVQVPPRVPLDTQLIIANGEQSKVSTSAMLHVVHAPPPPKVHHKVHVVKTSLLQQLLAPTVTVPIPGAVVQLYLRFMHHSTSAKTTKKAPAKASAHGSHATVPAQSTNTHTAPPARRAPAHGQKGKAPAAPAATATPSVQARVPLALIVPEALIVLLLMVRRVLRRGKRRSKVEKAKKGSKAARPAVDRAA